MIEVQNLTKKYGSSTVLSDLSLSIKEGEIVAIIGPSGGGKTTLLRMIDLLEPADRGTLIFDDLTVDMRKPSKANRLAVRRRIGFVFQQFNLFSHRTVTENITDVVRFGHGLSKDEAGELAVGVLKSVDLSDKADAYPITLSGGQAQRAAIARAIATKPKLLILDEPTSALDPELTGEVIAVIRDLVKEGMTMLLVTHHIGLAAELADRVIVLADGNIVEQGSVQDVLTNPKTARTAAFLDRVGEPGPASL